jgi:hypothetical protein
MGTGFAVALEAGGIEADLETRVHAVQESIKRTRFSLFLSTLAAGAIMICLWNTYISSDRDLATAHLPYPITGVSDPKRELSKSPDFAQSDIETYRQLMPNQFKAWIDSQYIAVNLLGIRISVSDFCVLGTTSLAFFLYYFLLCARRENREIGYLFRDFLKASVVDIPAFSGVSEDLVFYEVDDGGKPTIRKLIDPTRLSARAYSTYVAVSSYMIFNINTKNDDGPIGNICRPAENTEGVLFIRMMSGLMTGSSVLAIFAIFLCDLFSNFVCPPRLPSFFTSAFRMVNDTRPCVLTFYNSSPDRQVYMCAVSLATLLMGAFSWYMTNKIRAYQDATRTALESFRQKLVLAGRIERRPGESDAVTLAGSFGDREIVN